MNPVTRPDQIRVKDLQPGDLVTMWYWSATRSESLLATGLLVSIVGVPGNDFSWNTRYLMPGGELVEVVLDQLLFETRYRSVIRSGKVLWVRTLEIWSGKLYTDAHRMKKSGTER